MYLPELKVKLTLTTADGCTGTCVSEGDEFPAATWDQEPDAGTISATFDLLDENGEVLKEECAEELSGDEWRDLESNTDVDRVVYLARRGVSLSRAVYCVQQEFDPDGFDSELEAELDALRHNNRALFKLIEDLAKSPADEFYKPGDHMAGRVNDAWIKARDYT